MFSTLGLFLALFFIVLPASANRSRFYFETTGPATVGSVVSVKVLFDDDLPVNAYAVQIVYPADALEFIGFNDARSIIDVWENKMLLASGTVAIAGGSTVPFNGTKGELITLDFKALREGKVDIAFARTAAYAANGRGTAISPANEELTLAIGPVGGGAAGATNETADRASPQIRFLAIVPNPFNTREKLLSFSVADSGSGVKSSEIRTRSLFFWSDWSAVANPALLTNSAWAVEFRATDNAGNRTDAVRYDWGAIGAFASELLAALALAAFVLWRGVARK